MVTMAELEQRLLALERTVAELQKPDHRTTGHDWLQRISGMFENDPAFAEIVRLGREIRESEPYPEDAGR